MWLTQLSSMRKFFWWMTTQTNAKAMPLSQTYLQKARIYGNHTFFFFCACVCQSCSILIVCWVNFIFIHVWIIKYLGRSNKWLVDLSVRVCVSNFTHRFQVIKMKLAVHKIPMKCRFARHILWSSTQDFQSFAPF